MELHGAVCFKRIPTMGVFHLGLHLNSNPGPEKECLKEDSQLLRQPGAFLSKTVSQHCCTRVKYCLRLRLVSWVPTLPICALLRVFLEGLGESVFLALERTFCLADLVDWLIHWSGDAGQLHLRI